MSHVEEVEIECHDLTALRTAVERCGGEFMENQRTHAWWGTFVGDSRNMANSATAEIGGRAGRDPKTFGKCLHAIRMAGRTGKNGPGGPWEIGIVQARGGDGYSLVYDNYGSAGRQLEQMFGKDAIRIKDELAAEVSMRELIRDGFRVDRMVTSNGEIVLQADR